MVDHTLSMINVSFVTWQGCVDGGGR